MPRPSRLRTTLSWAVATIFVALAVAASLVLYRHFTEETRLLTFQVSPPKEANKNPTFLPTVWPDGRHLAFGVRQSGERPPQVWIQDLDSLAPRVLPGTEGGTGPFWSPDSRYLAFAADGKLKRIDISGGPAQTLCDGVTNLRGGSWEKSDVIVLAMSTSGGLFRVPASGGTPTPVSTLDTRMSESSHRWPWFLPDGRHFLYTAFSPDQNKSAVYAGDLDSKERKRVLAVNSNAVYSQPGYLLIRS